MNRLIATVGGVAAVIGFGLPVSSPAQAEPYGCPFDMTTDAGKKALDQSSADFTARVQAIAKDANDRKVPSGSPELNAILAQGNQLVKDRDNQRKVCYESLLLQPLPPLDEFNPAPLEPMPDRPMIVDSYEPPASNLDCTKLRAAYDSLGPVTDAAGAAAKLNGMKIPGLSWITGLSLAQCGLDAIPNAIDNPSPGNQQRVFDGACGAVGNITNGVINPCGDTPVS